MLGCKDFDYGVVCGCDFERDGRGASLGRYHSLYVVGTSFSPPKFMVVSMDQDLIASGSEVIISGGKSKHTLAVQC